MKISSGWNRLGDKWRARKTLTGGMERKPNRNVGARVKYYISLPQFLISFFLLWISVLLSLSCSLSHFCSFCVSVPFRDVYLHFYSFYSSFIVYGRANLLLVFCFRSTFVCVTTTTVAQSIHRERILSAVFILSSRSNSNPPWISPFYSSVIDLILLPFQYQHTHTRA